MTGAFAIFLSLLLILDSKTALTGAKDGIQMCIESVVPSLFPFIILSGIITTSFVGASSKTLKLLGNLCGIPSGAETLLLIGLIGGYPIGAQCVYRAYESGQISESDAQRMLGFCNNAGPAFIFGITAALFDSLLYPWIIWGIQILSAIATGMILPCKSSTTSNAVPQRNTDITTTIEKSVKTIAIICGWVISVKVILTLMESWFAGILPSNFLITLEGMIELSNGCMNLHKLTSNQIRFIYSNGFLSFGGLCVWLQTFSVTEKIDRSFFILGKLLQTVVTLLASTVISYVIFPKEAIEAGVLPTILLLALFISVPVIKKVVALRRNVLYNEKNKRRKERSYALS